MMLGGGIRSRSRRLLIPGAMAVAFIIAVVAAACGGGGEEEVPLAATPTPAAAAPIPTPTPSTPAPTPTAGGAVQFQWQLQEVDRGTKPALALDSQGVPTIIYMLERNDGWVKAAVWNGSGWNIATVAEGYFYGPPDVAIGGDDVPHVSYHDHQDPRQFRPEKGDAVHAFVKDGEWVVDAVFDDGHDGWDNRVVVDANNRPHISAIDPVDFGGRSVEYYFIDDNGEWQVEEIGSGALTYRFATAIAINPAGEPYITYYDQDETSLRLASRKAGEWSIETVDDEGETGLFSSLIVDSNGGVHISYLEMTGRSAGYVKYAFRSDPGSPWQVARVDTLEDIFFGFTGARNITSLALDSQGNPWIAYSDEKEMRLAIWDGSQWQVQTVATSGQNPLGQIVILKLDAQDRPHIGYAEVTSKDPLDGVIMYATASPS
ncbi:MAG: hypothetical protein ACE5IZ_01910 [Dehalococcoidia bacterium]